MIRKILAVIAGLIAAVVTFTIMQMIGGWVFELRTDLDFNDKAVVSAYMESMPVGAFAIVGLGYVIGSFLAGFVAKTISKTEGVTLPLIIGAVLTASGILNFVLLPHPVWFVVVGLLIFIPMTLIGYRTAK